MRFNDKIVLVTGAASGVGKAAAIRMAKEGATVILFDLNAELGEQTAQEISTLGNKVEFFKCDVSNEEQVEECFKKAVKKFGNINSLSHNAGLLKTYNTHEMSLKDWNFLLNINLTGTFLINKHAIPILLKNDVSYVVNCASIAAFHPHPWAACYSATKGGILSFTKSIFIEYHRKGLRANCVQLGSIETNLAAKFEFPQGADKDLIKFLVPYGKPNMAKPEHAAGAIAFLCSDDAFFINGTEVTVDGGRI